MVERIAGGNSHSLLTIAQQREQEACSLERMAGDWRVFTLGTSTSADEERIINLESEAIRRRLEAEQLQALHLQIKEGSA
ncbi:MAG: hypothetical protein ACE5DQ_01120 [Candidatus Paceibacterota bacterium]